MRAGAAVGLFVSADTSALALSFSGYDLLGVLGGGAFGVAYHGVDDAKNEVAIKRFRRMRTFEESMRLSTRRTRKRRL